MISVIEHFVYICRFLAEIKADGDELILPKKGNILAIQSFRNLKEIEKSYSLKSRPPRKLADF